MQSYIYNSYYDISVGGVKLIGSCLAATHKLFNPHKLMMRL